ncbi:hypothetical protein BCAR13_790080 [Paraburkholderia caribensis]|nr:hypothetical protein BCAR13_790080 [Paraburkholderia caribensis]
MPLARLASQRLVSGVEEGRRIRDERRRILINRPVIGVRIDDQLRVRQMLLKRERMPRRNDDVVAALDDQHGLPDRFQILQRAIVRHMPFANRLALGGNGLRAYLRIAIQTTQLALEKGKAGLLAGFGRSKMDRKPQMFGRVIARGEDFRRAAFRHVLRTMPRANEDDLADKVAALQRDLLRHEAPNRNAKHVDLGQAQRANEGNRIGTHFLETRRRLTRRAGDARIIEKDHFAILGKPVCHCRIPMIQGARVVLIEDKRQAALLAEPAVSEADTVGLDELGRCCVVTDAVHGSILYAPDELTGKGRPAGIDGFMLQWCEYRGQTRRALAMKRGYDLSQNCIDRT